MAKIVKIQFHRAGKLYDFGINDLDLAVGDRVVVETERGRSIGTIIRGPFEIEETPEGLKNIIRRAEAGDVEASARNTAKEKEAYDFCLAKIKERGMDMKLVKVEYLFDGSKAIFYFTADGRVDFRELVKDLAHQFHTRIEMRQIGVRDESKMVGGIGICGRELCCASFLREFEPVSVKMAKEQNLALNPTKISGQCGRLLCCLSYEFETYCSLKKCLPKCGKHVQSGSTEGEVVKMNVLEGTVTLRTGDDRLVEVRGDDIRPENIQDKPKKQQSKETGEPKQKDTGDQTSKAGDKEPRQGDHRGRRHHDKKKEKQRPGAQAPGDPKKKQ